MKLFWAMSETPTGTGKIIIGQDRFLWLAALAPPIWALWYKQWRWALFLFLLILLTASASLFTTTWFIFMQALSYTINIWYGFEAATLRQADYRRLGYVDIGPLYAVDEDEAYLLALARTQENAL